MKILGDLRTDTNLCELMNGGEGGIRTPETFKGFTRFPGVPLQPLEHLSFFRSAKIEQIFRTSKYLSPQSLYSFQEIQL